MHILYPRASRKIITQRKASGLSLHQPYQASSAKRFIYWNLHQSISARTTVLDNDPTEGILIITSVLDISPQHSSLPMNYHLSRLLHAATERLDYPWFSGFEEVLNVAQIVIGRDVYSKVKRDSFTFAHIIMERGCDAYVNRFLSPFPRQSSRELAILRSLCAAIGGTEIIWVLLCGDERYRSMIRIETEKNRGLIRLRSRFVRNEYFHFLQLICNFVLMHCLYSYGKSWLKDGIIQLIGVFKWWKMHFLTKVKIIIRCIHISFKFSQELVSFKIINNYPTRFSKKATNSIALLIKNIHLWIKFIKINEKISYNSTRRKPTIERLLHTSHSVSYRPSACKLDFWLTSRITWLIFSIFLNFTGYYSSHALKF